MPRARNVFIQPFFKQAFFALLTNMFFSDFSFLVIFSNKISGSNQNNPEKKVNC